MLFGLMNAPSVFQRLMDQVLREFDFVCCYLYYVVIFLRTSREHVEHLRVFFSSIQKHGLLLKLSKCFLAQNSVHLLGHIVDKKRIRVYPDKIQATSHAPVQQPLRNYVVPLASPATTPDSSRIFRDLSCSSSRNIF